MRKKLINICGTARSGSTMLDLMLGNDPRAFSLGELYAWFRPFRTHHFKIICSCKQDVCPWEKLKMLKEEEFYKNSFEILDVDILVDSSKDHPWVIDNNLWANHNGILVYNILLFKDFQSFSYSYWKRGLSIKLAKKNYIKYYKRFFQMGLPYISLDYNKLAVEPAATLKKACDILDIPYFQGKERFWEKKYHHHLFGSLGTRRQVESSKSKISKQKVYPSTFKNNLKQYQKDIREDQAFQDIISKLEDGEKGISKGFPNLSIMKPYWYYMLKGKQKIRQRFPKKWKYDQ